MPRSSVPKTPMGAPLSNKPPKRRGSFIPLILVLALVGVAGYFGWKEFDRRQKLKQEKKEEYLRRLAEKEAREREAAEAAKKKPEEKKPEVVQVVEEKKPEPVKKKSAMEIWQEREAVRKEVLAKIAEARKNPEAKPINGFAGVRFDEPLKEGSAVRWGTVLDNDAGDSVAKRGASFAVYGPKKPFMTLGSNPLVWVTPKTRRPWRIEFSRPLALKPGTLHEAETTNVVAFLSSRFKSEPFIPLPIDPEVKGCEFIYPIGTATIRVAEDGDMLTFSVEREDVRAMALAESEELRTAEKGVAETDGKTLDSKRYPHRSFDMRKYPGLKFKEGTPLSFCGIVFASPPPESATVVVPMQGPKGFFLDYEWAKCRPFRGFSRGRADIDSWRGGVYGVTLFSEGGYGGLDDKEYFESVKAALSGHYKVQPEEKKGEGEFPQLTYKVGELTITFGPDTRGGFLMRAENQVLAELAKQDPAQARKKSARR